MTRLNSVGRLLVRDVASPVRNLVVNPDGEFGGYGWTTAASGASLIGGRQPEGSGTGWDGQYRLRYTTGSGSGDQLMTEPIPCLAGQWVRAGWEILAVDRFYRAVLRYTDESGTEVGAIEIWGYDDTTGIRRPGAFQAPAGTVFVKLQFKFYTNASGADPGAGRVEHLRAVRVKVGDTEVEMNNPRTWDSDTDDWIDVIGAASEIRVTRKDLDVGTLAATLHSWTLDTARPDSPLRVGREIMLTVSTPVPADPISGTPASTVAETLFRGRLAKPLTTAYPRGRKARPVITLNATDQVARLAEAVRPNGVATISGLRSTLEGAGVPWRINDSSAQIAAPTTVSKSDNATAIDQIAVTRDSNLGYAWVSRNGTLYAYDRDLMPSDVALVLDPARWSDLDTGHDPTAVINVVKIDYLTYTGTGKSVVKRYGPYRNEASIAEYGVQSATFTVHSAAENATTIAALAAEILSLNSDAVVSANTVTLPVASWWRDYENALVDLYDLVEVRDPDQDLVDQVRVVSIEHTMTASLDARGDAWTVVLGFDQDGAVARPQRIPAP